MLSSSFQIPSPIQQVKYSLFEEYGLSVLVKRDDLIHPLLGGNKYRKLSGNIQSWLNNGVKSVLSFGGAFSNHLAALGGVTSLFDVEIHCIIRGELDVDNPTTNLAREQGVTIHYVSREEYRLKELGSTCQDILAKSNAVIVPEGGSNELSNYGLAECYAEIAESCKADLLLVAAGTGGTAKGLILANGTADFPIKIEVFNALKDDYLKDDIIGETYHEMISDYHFGGYARVNAELISFINDFKTETGIPLDPIYNGKLMYGFCDRVRKGQYSKGTAVTWLHTGGLQGITAYNYMVHKSGKGDLLA